MNSRAAASVVWKNRSPSTISIMNLGERPFLSLKLPALTILLVPPTNTVISSVASSEKNPTGFDSEIMLTFLHWVDCNRSRALRGRIGVSILQTFLGSLSTSQRAPGELSGYRPYWGCHGGHTDRPAYSDRPTPPIASTGF